MPYYSLERLGTGTYADPWRPDIPAGVSWVGNTMYVVEIDTTAYLVKTSTDLAMQPVGPSRHYGEVTLDKLCQWAERSEHATCEQVKTVWNSF